jgi:sulfite reductase beta subunit-like hemoprotein
MSSAVTADRFAGTPPDEIEDPRIWCEIVRQWSTCIQFVPAAQVQDRRHWLAQ